jgi:hypothetical protein
MPLSRWDSERLIAAGKSPREAADLYFGYSKQPNRDLPERVEAYQRGSQSVLDSPIGYSIRQGARTTLPLATSGIVGLSLLNRTIQKVTNPDLIAQKVDFARQTLADMESLTRSVFPNSSGDARSFFRRSLQKSPSWRSTLGLRGKSLPQALSLVFDHPPPAPTAAALVFQAKRYPEMLALKAQHDVGALSPEMYRRTLDFLQPRELSAADRALGSELLKAKNTTLGKTVKEIEGAMSLSRLGKPLRRALKAWPITVLGPTLLGIGYGAFQVNQRAEEALRMPPDQIGVNLLRGDARQILQQSKLSPSSFAFPLIKTLTAGI